VNRNQLFNFNALSLPSAEGMTANTAAICQTRINNLLHAGKTMHMLARHRSNSCEIIADILSANLADTNDSRGDLVCVFGKGNGETSHVPDKPIGWHWLPRVVVVVVVVVGVRLAVVHFCKFVSDLWESKKL
jgi:hypothetical protein